jgi:tRNA (guanine37-N1)-methyltransferase
MMRSLCAVVPKEKGEDARRMLMSKGVLRTELVIDEDNDLLLIPITERIDLGYSIEERDFREREKTISDYKELLDLPDELRDLLPSSMDLIGDIAIVRLPKELEGHKSDIGAAIARAHNVKTVAIDKGVEGDLRLRELELVFGSETHTTHREFGLTYELDVAKVYFSPRLSTERKRIADSVSDGETVIDMFSGIGPFSIMVAKFANPGRVYAIDINPEAIRFLNKNVARNRIEKVVSILGDAKEILKSLERADRIIMNLPLSSFQFFETALSSIKEDGIIHYYEVLNRDDASDRREQLVKVASDLKKELELNQREVKAYSATKAHYAFDLSVRG